MTLTNYFRRLFSRYHAAPVPARVAAENTVSPQSVLPTPSVNQSAQLLVADLTLDQTLLESLPYWLTDEDALRDEGVLFGLSDAGPDEKVAEIRAYFGRQVAPLDRQIEQHTEKIGELNLLIEQWESRMVALRKKCDDLLYRELTPTHLLRTVVSLLLSLGMCIGNFYLIDQTLQPSFANHWIAVGVFLAGMFNLLSRTSFFYEETTRLTARRFVEEVGLPLAASVFILAQALKTQSTGEAIALVVFVFFLFLLAGKLLLATLTTLQNGLTASQSNRQLLSDKAHKLPVWEADADRLEREIDAVRAQKWPIVTALNHLNANRTQLNTRRDQLVNLFLSEFELARSLRDRLPEQERKLMTDYK